MNEEKYYVYVHYRLDTGEPFYVGKGEGGRAYKKSGRNEYWNRIVAKHGYSVTLVAQNMSEELAFLCEIEKIDQLRKLGYKLANMTDGGDGTVGHVKSEEHRKKLSDAHLGKKHTEEHREKNRQAKLGKKPTAETIAKRSAALKGRPTHNKGKPHTEEHKEKIRLAGIGRVYSEESRAKMKAAAIIREAKKKLNKLKEN